MKILVAIDSFKESLTSLEAGYAVKAGILRAMPASKITVMPLADGGEGTAEALINGMGGKKHTVRVTGPLGEEVDSSYGIIDGTNTAVIEMSSAAGLALVPREKRDPMHTTTYGVGELIVDAVKRGCRKIIIGIGGSATNDGGAGMLCALGYGLCKNNGESISPGAAGLAELEYITEDNVIPELRECSFRIACDVTNPLCGKNGASAVYGPQKGATPDMVREMDHLLSRFAAVTAKKYPHADPNMSGAGAAGGLGFAFSVFTNATLGSGVDLILEETAMESQMREHDIIVTGEGRLDEQTAMGKAPAGVAALAKKYNKPVIAFAGCVTGGAKLCHNSGIDAYFPILRTVCPLGDALDPKNAAHNAADTAEDVFRLIATFGT